MGQIVSQEQRKNQIIQDFIDKFIELSECGTNDNVPFIFKMSHLLLNLSRRFNAKFYFANECDLILNFVTYNHYFCETLVTSYSSPKFFNLLNCCKNVTRVLRNIDVNDSVLDTFSGNKKITIDLNFECYNLNKLIRDNAIIAINRHNNEKIFLETQIKSKNEILNEICNKEIEKKNIENEIESNNKLIRANADFKSSVSIINRNKELHEKLELINAFFTSACNVEHAMFTYLDDLIKIKNKIENLEILISKMLYEPIDDDNELNKNDIVTQVNPSNVTVICPVEIDTK